MFIGQAATKHLSGAGSGSNILCLDNQNSDRFTGSHSSDHPASIYALRYHSTDSSSKNGHDVPCAVCLANHKVTIMIPNRASCPSGWNKQYDGALMANPENSNYHQWGVYLC